MLAEQNTPAINWGYVASGALGSIAGQLGPQGQPRTSAPSWLPMALIGLGAAVVLVVALKR